MIQNRKKIRLNDGDELDVSWCGASEGILWVDGLNLSLADAATLFSDPAKTSTIIAPVNIIHTGYTNLMHISINYDGLIKVALKKQ